MRTTLGGLALAFCCAAWGLVTPSARAEEEEDWFDQDPEAEQGTDSEAAAQEAGAVELDSDTGGGGWLTPGTVDLWAGFHLGMGGNAHYESEGFDTDTELVATLGLQAGGEYVLLDYFAIGGELRLSWINTEPAADRDLGRDLLIDLVARPRGRYVFESIGLELYGQLPVGLSFPRSDEEKAREASVGFTLGVGAGLGYFFTEHWGVMGDFTWLMHWYGEEQTEIASGTESDATVRLGQLTLFANAVYAF